MNIRTNLAGVLTLAISLTSLNSFASLQDSKADIVRVTYSQEDLAAAEKQQSLYQRISRAAESACGSPHARVAGSLRRATDNKVCIRKAMDKAVDQINNAAIHAIHQG